jgi:hypothetical protein
MQFNPYNNPGLPMEIYGNSGYQNYYNPQMYQQQRRPMPQAQPYVPPKVVMGEESSKPKKGLFTVVKDGSAANPIPIINDPEPKKKSSKKKKNDDSNTTAITKSDNSEKVTPASVEDAPTSYTYMETTGMLRETLGQIDALNGELITEFQNVRQSRTMKNKYNVLVGISENIGSLIGNRIQAIREINNSITKANDLDYKKLKDIKAAQAVMNDDKYIADVYQAMISNPANMPSVYEMPQVDSSIFGSGVVRATINPNNTGGIVDAGYLNYLSNLTPEQNLMRYENNPNVKQVVVYDAATNNKFFQMMDTSTGEVIPNVPVYGENIMEDTTLDIEHGIAKNLNIRENFPIVKINSYPTMAQY